MRVVVLGGTGLIGSRLVAVVTDRGHDAVPASPNTGVNSVTGEGVAAALAGADVVVDVSNSPSFAADDVLAFFRTATTTLLTAAADAGVRHYVALSVVGADRLTESGYLRAKDAQERLIRDGGVPYSVVRATQFYEFAAAIADAGAVDGEVHVTPALFQPMAAADVSAAVAEVALAEPVNGVREIGGPVAVPMADLVRARLAASGDQRPVVADEQARYFGALLEERDLLPGPDAHLATTTFEEWLAAQG